MIPDDNKQSGEIAEIPSNKCNDEPNNEGRQKEMTEVNCITTDNNTQTETSSLGELIQSSENGTFSVIPDEDKLNGENQEIDFKEHNDEANNDHTQEITEANRVTSDDKIETETPNEAGVSDERPAQSSEIEPSDRPKVSSLKIALNTLCERMPKSMNMISSLLNKRRESAKEVVEKLRSEISTLQLHHQTDSFI